MIEIRAHHLLCIPHYRGGGYSKEFAKHFRQVQNFVRAHPDGLVKILKSCDVVCGKCPHFGVQKNICVKRVGINKYILLHDEKVLRELKLGVNSVHRIRDVFNLSVDKISSEKLKKICCGCEFLKFCVKFGVNASFVRDLNK